GGASELEKSDIVDSADLALLTRFDRGGGEDALRDGRKQWRRNRRAFDAADEESPVYPTIASHFHDEGLTRAFEALLTRLGAEWAEHAPIIAGGAGGGLIPGSRVRYLAEIAAAGRESGRRGRTQAAAADGAQ